MSIRIDTDGSVTNIEAINYVAVVISQGFQSEAAGIPHYCWHTSFKDGVEVVVRRKRKPEAADSFYVYKS